MQVLYQHLLVVLSGYRLPTVLYSIRQDMIWQREPLPTLLRSRRWREQLFQLAEQFGLVNRDDVRAAIHSDNVDLVVLFSSVLKNDRLMILSLMGQDARDFLALARDILSLDCVGDDTAKLTRRLSTKLAVEAQIFPRAKRVTWRAQEPMAYGGTAWVYNANIGSQRVVLKRILSTPNTLAFQQVIREATTWSWLDHKYILPCLGIDCDTFAQPAIVSPLMPHTLSNYLPSTAPSVIAQLADALAYIHSMGIIHGDIKPENIFFDTHGNVQLGDFGISIYADTTTLVLSGKGTMARMAPELWRDAPDSDTPVRKTFSSDMYSFGLLGYELYADKLPWNGLKPVFCLVNRGRLEVYKPSRSLGHRLDMPRYIWEVVERCISIYYNERPTSAQVVQDLHQPHY